MSSVALGSTLVVFGGLLNGSWNLPTKEKSPPCVVALSSGWSWDHVWAVFQLLQALLNAIVIVSVITIPVLSAVYSATSASDLALVCTFCVLWGFGSLSFGMSIKLLGMAVGTSTPMGVIQVVGTLLPIAQDWKSVTVRSGTLTLFSVLFGLMGFTLGALAAHSKGSGAADQENGHVAAAAGKSPPESDCGAAKTIEDGGAMGVNESAEIRRRSLTKGNDTTHSSPAVTVVQSHASSLAPSDPLGVAVSTDQLVILSAGGNSVGRGGPTVPSREAAAPPEAPVAIWIGLTVALFSGLMSSMLQFAFVFGNGMIEEAEKLGVSKVAAPMVVWLLAFEIGTIPNVAVSAWRITRGKTWGGFLGPPPSQILKSTGLCLVMASFFMGHIHLYGAGAALIGNLGAAIAWPILMSVTVLTSQLWSVLLNEWRGAPYSAHWLNAASMLSLIASVVLAACAGLS